jgi:RIO-like serine/threonine protein kinase
MIPSLQEARTVVYEERKEAAQRVFTQIRECVTISKQGVRTGHLFNFDILLDGRKDVVVIQHPNYGRVKFESPIQLVAWILKQYA